LKTNKQTPTKKKNNLATLHFSTLYQPMIKKKKAKIHSALSFLSHKQKRKLDKVVLIYGERNNRYKLNPKEWGLALASQP
jgi:hypothetical protein